MKMIPRFVLVLLMICLGRAAAQEPAVVIPPESLAKVGETPFPVVGLAANGGLMSLSDLKGQVVLLYLFTTQPGPGMAELRMLATHTWPRFRAQGLRIIGVVRGSEAPEIAKVASSMHVDFPLLPDPKKEIFLHFAARGHPRAYLVGRDGTIKLTSLGYTDDEVDRIEAAIERELRP